MKPYKLHDTYPVTGEFRPEYYRKIDLSLLTFDNESNVQTGLEAYLRSQAGDDGKSVFLYGGYLEQRNFYSGSLLFNNGVSNRNIHLGIDIWADAGTPIFAAFDGQIHSFAYNNGHLDYGATIIIQYDAFFVLYGHLSRKSLLGLYPGKPVFKSQKIAELGRMSENGGWVPHLHIQVIKDIGSHIGDYPGLCDKETLSFYRENCLDPDFLVLV